MRARHVLPLLATLALLGAARPAAASVDLGLGGDWIEGGTGELNLTLSVDRFVARRLSVGFRGGAAFFESSDHLGVPLDARLTVHVQRIYFEGLVGPWILLDADDAVKFHGAFGFGLESRGVDVGLEVGVLGDATMLGLRVAFRL
jgi:hypothetical protein